jgi:hypothetical protein
MEGLKGPREAASTALLLACKPHGPDPRSRRFSERVSVESAEPRPRVLALATGVVLALLAAPAVAASGPAPSRMVLRASDLPPGFLVVRGETGPYTNSDVVRDFGPSLEPKLRRWGRVTGYRALYRQRDIKKGSLPGVIEFGASATLYRSARGAHAALADRAAGCRNRTFTIIGLGGHRPVGSDTLVCTRGTRIGTARARIFLVQWRNRRATGGVYVEAFEGAVTPVAALTGVREQNRRMTAELLRG